MDILRTYKTKQYDLKTVKGLIDARTNDMRLLNHFDLNKLIPIIQQSGYRDENTELILTILQKEYPEIIGLYGFDRTSETQCLMELHANGIRLTDLKVYLSKVSTFNNEKFLFTQMSDDDSDVEESDSEEELVYIKPVLEENVVLRHTIHYSPAHLLLKLKAMFVFLKKGDNCEVELTLNDQQHYEFTMNLIWNIDMVLLEWILNYGNNNTGNRPHETHALYVLDFLIKMHTPYGTKPFPLHFEQAAYTVRNSIENMIKYPRTEKYNWYDLPIELEPDINSDLRPQNKVEYFIYTGLEFKPQSFLYLAKLKYGQYLEYEIIYTNGYRFTNIIADSNFARMLFTVIIDFKIDKYYKKQALECLCRMWD